MLNIPHLGRLECRGTVTEVKKTILEEGIQSLIG